jgi:hypothetical protein
MVQVKEDLITSIMDSYLHHASLKLTEDPEKLPVRHLMPGKLVDLYMLYTAAATAAGDPVAGNTTFRKVWHGSWRKCLRFRKVSTHSMCATCHRLKAFVRHASSIREHAAAAAMFLEHIRAQWMDRTVYWRCRSLARAADSTTCCMIVDGMDRSKFALPRWYLGAPPKGISDHNRRPVLEVSAVLVHGHALYLYVTDEDTSIGASWTCEIIMQSLDKIWKRCQMMNRKFPEHLIIQADNTVREAKNSILHKLLASLTMADIMVTTTVQHLRVGHTHEDVDAIFGLITGYLREADEDLQCPEDVVNLLHSKLITSCQRSGMDLEVRYVQGMRNWKSMLPSEVSLVGAYGTRNDIEAPHSCTFIKRASLALGYSLQQTPEGRGSLPCVNMQVFIVNGHCLPRYADIIAGGGRGGAPFRQEGA